MAAVETVKAMREKRSTAQRKTVGMDGGGLYIHVPFCRRKCRYCDFYSLPARPASRARDPRDLFLEGLDLELRRLPEHFHPATLFIGGGTPSVLAARRLESLCERLRGRIRPEALCEWTFEANPESLSPAVAAVWATHGVHRVSLGVQSFNDRVLAFLGRAHDAAGARRAFRLLRQSGFTNLGLDLMFGYPGQTPSDWQADLEAALDLAPDHLSMYALSIEPHTPLGHERAAGRLREPPDGAVAQRYHQARRFFKRAGYLHYELSNFALPGRQCLHNRLYWTGGVYVGLGPAAHSHYRGMRYANLPDLYAWHKALTAHRPAVAFRERLAPEARARETLVMNLRLTDGIRRDAFREQTGFDYRALSGPAIERLTAQGLLVEQHGRLRLSARALFISNSIFSELV